MANPNRDLYEPPYDDALLYDSEVEPERHGARPLVVLLGVVVLAAFGGVIWVAYNTGVTMGAKDGKPPVLAENDPIRVPVTDPSATSEGLELGKSYDRLMPDGSETSGAEKVLPAPEQPVDAPSAQDVADGAVPAPVDSMGGPVVAAAPIDPRMDATIDTSGNVASGLRAVSPQAPVSAPAPREVPPVIEDEMIPPPPAPVAPRRIVAPATPKPVAAAPVVSAPVAQPAPPVQVARMDEVPPAQPVATPAAAGGVKIQLGSFPSDALAAAAWGKVKQANQSLLGSYSPAFETAEIPGKGTWYRLRVAGFADKSAAKAVCQQLQSAGHACIIVSK